MPSRRPPPEPPLEVRRFTPEQAGSVIQLIKTRIDDVEALDAKAVRHNDEKVRAIERRISTTVLEVFGENSPEYRDHRYHHISAGRPARMLGFREDPRTLEGEKQQSFAEGIPRTVTMLESLIQTVRERTDEPEPVLGGMVEVREMRPPELSNKVFVVHGRKEAPREAVARFIAQLGLQPVILQEQASEGRTIIEKFERHAGVGYAVVLFTADDRGGLLDQDPATYPQRARQNVVLELGYFIGKLGRGRVCVLHEQGVEIPSDFHGVVYVPLDPGGAWRFALAREMKVAGLEIDMNRAVG